MKSGQISLKTGVSRSPIKLHFWQDSVFTPKWGSTGLSGSEKTRKNYFWLFKNTKNALFGHFFSICYFVFCGRLIVFFQIGFFRECLRGLRSVILGENMKNTIFCKKYSQRVSYISQDFEKNKYENLEKTRFKKQEKTRFLTFSKIFHSRSSLTMDRKTWKKWNFLSQKH